MLLTLKCLELEGEVILPSFTFAVTGHVLAWNGLKPVYVDIDPRTCLIDPAEAEKAITPNTSTILGVHAANRTSSSSDRPKVMSETQSATCRALRATAAS